VRAEPKRREERLTGEGWAGVVCSGLRAFLWVDVSLIASLWQTSYTVDSLRDVLQNPRSGSVGQRLSTLPLMCQATWHVRPDCVC
jgi:hypothetical protein